MGIIPHNNGPIEALKRNLSHRYLDKLLNRPTLVKPLSEMDKMIIESNQNKFSWKELSVVE